MAGREMSSSERTGTEVPAEEPSDGKVVRAVLDGQTERFRLLVQRYQDVLYRHAVRMVDRPDEASDLVQQALVNGYQNLDRCRHPEKVGGWLYRITSNLCKDHLKSRRQDGVSLDDTGPLESGGGSPDDALEHWELGDALERALGRLTPDQREAFLMKHLEERSYEEMSELMDASVSALKMRVHRAREELQELLSHYR